MSKKKDVVYSQPNEQSRNFSDTATKNQFYNTRDSFGLEGKKSSVHSAQNQNQLHDQQNGGNGDNNVEIMKKDPLQYYKTKSQLLSDRVSILQGENERLRIDNAHLRNLNMDYVKQLNTISHEKTTRNEQIIITPQFFESEENSAQDFIRKLANNYRLLQKEQKQLIQHCQVMERDLEIYKTQIGDAENILEKLRKTGETSIQNLIFQLKDQSTIYFREPFQ